MSCGRGQHASWLGIPGPLVPTYSCHSALVRVCPAEVQATVDQKMGEKFHLVTYPGPDDPPAPSVAEMRFFPSGVKATLVETFRGPAGSVIDPISWPEVMSNTGAVPSEFTSTARPALLTAGPAVASMSPANERMSCRPSARREEPATAPHMAAAGTGMARRLHPRGICSGLRRDRHDRAHTHPGSVPGRTDFPSGGVHLSRATGRWRVCLRVCLLGCRPEHVLPGERSNVIIPGHIPAGERVRIRIRACLPVADRIRVPEPPVPVRVFGAAGPRPPVALISSGDAVGAWVCRRPSAGPRWRRAAPGVAGAGTGRLGGGWSHGCARPRR